MNTPDTSLAVISTRLVEEFAQEIQELQELVANPQNLQRGLLHRVRVMLAGLRRNPDNSIQILKLLGEHVAKEKTRLHDTSLKPVKERLEEIETMIRDTAQTRGEYIRESHGACIHDLQTAGMKLLVSDDATFSELCQCLRHDLNTDLQRERIRLHLMVFSMHERQQNMRVLYRQAENQHVDSSDAGIVAMFESCNHDQWNPYTLQAFRNNAHEWIPDVFNSMNRSTLDSSALTKLFVAHKLTPGVLNQHESLTALDHEDHDLAMMNVTLHNLKHYRKHLKQIEDSMTGALENLGSITKLIERRVRMNVYYRQSVQFLEGMIDEKQDAMTIEEEIRDLGQGLSDMMGEILAVTDSMKQSAIRMKS